MQLNANIQIDQYLADKIEANDLNCVDCFKLAAAEHLAGLFPALPVYLVPQQQTSPITQLPPALFVQVFDLHREKRLGTRTEWSIAVNVAYISIEKNSESEQQDAAVRIMDAIEHIPPLEGMEYPYTIYSSDSKTVDGIVNITGTLTVWERRTDDAPIIEVADTNIYIKEGKTNGCS